MGASDPGVPVFTDPGVPDPGVPDFGAADPGVPDFGGSDPGVPDSGVRTAELVEHVVPTFAQAVNIQHLFQQLPYPQATPQPPPSQAPAGQKIF